MPFQFKKNEKMLFSYILFRLVLGKQNFNFMIKLLTNQKMGIALPQLNEEKQASGVLNLFYLLLCFYV